MKPGDNVWTSQKCKTTSKNLSKINQTNKKKPRRFAMSGPCNLVPGMRGYHSTNHGILNSLLGLDPLDDSSVVLPLPPLIPIVKSKTVSRHCQMSPAAKTFHWNCCLGQQNTLTTYKPNHWALNKWKMLNGESRGFRDANSVTKIKQNHWGLQSAYSW